MLIRFFFGKRTSKDLEGTLRDARLRSRPRITGLSLAPGWTQVALIRTNLATRYRKVPKTAWHSTVVFGDNRLTDYDTVSYKQRLVPLSLGKPASNPQSVNPV